MRGAGCHVEGTYTLGAGMRDSLCRALVRFGLGRTEIVMRSKSRKYASTYHIREQCDG